LLLYVKLIIFNLVKINIGEDEQNVVRQMGLTLRAARIRDGQTQDELAVRIGVTRWTVAAMEKGDPKVSLAAWVKASGLLGLLQGWELVLQEEEDPFARYDREQSAKNGLRTRVRK